LHFRNGLNLDDINCK